MDGSIGNQRTFILRTIAAPYIVLAEIEAQILLQDRTVQRADHLNVQCSRLLEQSLYLCAVLADNVEIIAAGFAGPAFLCIQCAELAKAVCREQNLLRGLVSNHNLRPVNHRSHEKVQRVAAETDRVTFLDRNRASGEIKIEELRHKRKGLCVADQLHVRIHLSQLLDISGMIRLQMRDHQIIYGASVQRLGKIVHPGVGCARINGVHHGYLLIQNQVGVIGYAIRNNILAFKQIEGLVICADV